MAETRNAFTVDLEDWFHICAAGHALAPGNWDRLPSRVELTTRLLLELLDAANVRATFFVVGWVAERHAELVDSVRRAREKLSPGLIRIRPRTSSSRIRNSPATRTSDTMYWSPSVMLIVM